MKSIYTILAFIAISLMAFSCADTKKTLEFDSKDKYSTNRSKQVQTSNTLQNDIDLSRSNAITNVVDKASGAIVGINVTEVYRVRGRQSIFDMFYGRNPYREYQMKGLGSGFLISEDGYILTNHHVAGDASEIVVTLMDGETYEAQIVGTDFVTDISLLKINAGYDLPYLDFHAKDDLMVGEWTIAFGNPFGLFDINSKPTVTVGVVSNYGVNFTHEDQEGVRVYRDMVQTDAAISSGNSGGPLLNAEGKVIGMNTTIYSTSQSQKGAGSIGIGFAIPSNRILETVDYIKNGSSINRNFAIGMEVSELSSNLKEYLRTNRKQRGVVVQKVFRNSPAADAGLKPGDIITSIDGLKINKADDFGIVIYDGKVGDALPVTYLRQGRTEETQLRLVER
ncbi:MAG: trypsin-like peptidase domain-containing protein [Candidatus Kapaibacteriales bacterium]